MAYLVKGEEFNNSSFVVNLSTPAAMSVLLPEIIALAILLAAIYIMHKVPML